MRISVKEAAKMMEVSEDMIRYHMQVNGLPIGIALKGKGKSYQYIIYREQVEAFISGGGIWRWVNERLEKMD